MRRALLVIPVLLLVSILFASVVAATTTINIKLEPEAAAPDASGHAKLQFFPDEELICYSIKWKDVDGPVTGGHIHTMATGGIVVSLFGGPLGTATTYPGDKFKVSDCVSASAATINTILADPSGYYVNLHTDPAFASALHGPLAE
jgi:hypothetical protein